MPINRSISPSDTHITGDTGKPENIKIEKSRKSTKLKNKKTYDGNETNGASTILVWSHHSSIIHQSSVRRKDTPNTKRIKRSKPRNSVIFYFFFLNSHLAPETSPRLHALPHKSHIVLFLHGNPIFFLSPNNFDWNKININPAKTPFKISLK